MSLEGARNLHMPKSAPPPWCVLSSSRLEDHLLLAPLKVAGSLEATKAQVVRGHLWSSVTAFIKMPKEGREIVTPTGSEPGVCTCVE